MRLADQATETLKVSIKSTPLAPGLNSYSIPTLHGVNMNTQRHTKDRQRSAGQAGSTAHLQKANTSTIAVPGRAATSIPTNDDIAACMFWKAPPEIRDMIYGLVYGGHRTVKVKSRMFWEVVERKRRHDDPDNYEVYACRVRVSSHLLMSNRHFRFRSRRTAAC